MADPEGKEKRMPAWQVLGCASTPEMTQSLVMQNFQTSRD